MRNAKVIIPIIFGVLAGGLGAGIFLWSKQTQTKVPSAVVASPTPTNAPVELTTWNDQAGFTFQYPKDVDINPHDEDKENYAHVEITHKSHPGSVIVWMKDLPAPDLAGWIKKEKRFTGASVLDTTLGGKPAKKILVAGSTKMIVVGAIDGDVLVTVEGELTDSDYWSTIHQKAVDSFVFSQSGIKTGSVPVSSGDWGDSAVTEEEVLE